MILKAMSAAAAGKAKKFCQRHRQRLQLKARQDAATLCKAAQKHSQYGEEISGFTSCSETARLLAHKNRATCKLDNMDDKYSQTSYCTLFM
jgi:hypothetical protein